MSRALAVTAMIALAGVGACAQRGMNSDMNMDAPQGRMSMPEMDRMMTGWPMASKDAAKFMTEKYGMPAAMTSDMAGWGRTGPWKRTVVFAREYAHEFPMHHTDVMQQWIDYKAPWDMYDELAMYDGSVVLERTAGEMSARCDKEGANFLALNLAHDIVMGKQSVEGARRMYGEQVMAMKAGRAAPYMMGLMFQVSGPTNDPDRPVMGMPGNGRP